MTLNSSQFWLALVVTTCALAVGCNDNDKKQAAGTAAPSQTTPSDTSNKPATIHTDYKALTPEQLFASQYEKVELVCSIFAVDAAKLTDSDQPAQTATIQVFPVKDTQDRYAVQSPSGHLRAKLNIAPKLATWDFKMDDQIIGQSPIVQVTGDLSTELDGNDGPMSSDGTIAASLFFTNPPSDLPIGGQSYQDQTGAGSAEKDGDVEVKCRLVDVPISSASSGKPPQPSSQDCAKLAGTWANKSSEIEGQLPTVIKIDASCKETLLQADPKHDDESLLPDYLFWDRGQLRTQYTLKPGAVDADGKPIPLPLSDDMKKALQGNVYQVDDNTISFGIDSIDQWCHSGDHPVDCPGAKFYRQ